MTGWLLPVLFLGLTVLAVGCGDDGPADGGPDGSATAVGGSYASRLETGLMALEGHLGKLRADMFAADADRAAEWGPILTADVVAVRDAATSLGQVAGDDGDAEVKETIDGGVDQILEGLTLVERAIATQNQLDGAAALVAIANGEAALAEALASLDD